MLNNFLILNTEFGFRKQREHESDIFIVMLDYPGLKWIETQRAVIMSVELVRDTHTMHSD